ncbi:MAG: CapA family protein [Paludibacteraceae bacterium]|nr:CapA family protein [Paludibacteraceae bacterium]
MKIRITILALVCALTISAQETVSLLFGGDAMCHSPQFQYAFQSGTNSYDFTSCFRYIQPYLRANDLRVVNFEVTLGGEPYSGYPNFSCPDAYYYALKDAGWQVMTLANNHILDKGRRGMERTLDMMAEIPTMGAYRDSADRAERYPLQLVVRGVKLALFNCTYGCNGYFPLPPNKVNFIDTTQIKRDLLSIADQDVDLKVMYIHWGLEYELKAVRAQREMAVWLAEHGFDIIIGGHPHVVEDAEVITTSTGKQVPVYYSLGNLISNQRRLHTNGGILVRVDINKVTRQVVGTSYLPCYVHKGNLTIRRNGKTTTERQYFILPTTDYLSGAYHIQLDKDSDAALKLFDKNTRERLKNMTLMQRL